MGGYYLEILPNRAQLARYGLMISDLQNVVATALGAEPSRITARTGPAVCGRCYEGPEAMRAEVAAVEPAAHSETNDAMPTVAWPSRRTRRGAESTASLSATTCLRIDSRAIAPSSRCPEHGS